MCGKPAGQSFLAYRLLDFALCEDKIIQLDNETIRGFLKNKKKTLWKPKTTTNYSDVLIGGTDCLWVGLEPNRKSRTWDELKLVCCVALLQMFTWYQRNTRPVLPIPTTWAQSSSFFFTFHTNQINVTVNTRKAQVFSRVDIWSWT